MSDRLRDNVRFAIDEAMNTATGYAQGMETVDAEREREERIRRWDSSH